MKIIILSALVSGVISAQWLHYPTPGIPRTPEGKPNLEAPTPRAADGKPDLSGIWKAEENKPCPPRGCNDMQINEEFGDIGWTLKGGLPFQKWAADLTKLRSAANGREDPTSHCLPAGVVKSHTLPLYRKMVQTPGLLLILNERNATYRQIFLDGRPREKDPQPSWNGYSTAKWDGDTLVVETSGFRDDMWLDRNGSPATDQARITERFRRINFGKLEIELTVDDPKAYTKPWTVKINQFFAPDTELMDYICAENEKDEWHLVGK
jgi:hypothetical protein